MTTFDKVYEAVRRIPKGSVATYGQIAEAIGNRRLS
ncbi:MAG: MGMT family protein, partial [Oscillospiraceae bacterium]|nr:MGMT family protein [Oscillospiraceae bacterium]